MGGVALWRQSRFDMGCLLHDIVNSLSYLCRTQQLVIWSATLVCDGSTRGAVSIPVASASTANHDLSPSTLALQRLKDVTTHPNGARRCPQFE